MDECILGADNFPGYFAPGEWNRGYWTLVVGGIPAHHRLRGANIKRGHTGGKP